jgi:RNA-binding protein
MNTLTPTERRALRARAHPLHPVVIVGHHGLTPAVLHEIDVALTAHELIKIRVTSDVRADRDALLATICAGMDAAPVQHLGKVLTVWRPKPPPEPAPREARAPRRARDTGAAANTGASRSAAKKPQGSGVTEVPAGRRGRSAKPRHKNTPARRRPSDVTDTGTKGKRRSVKGGMAREDRQRAPATAKGPFEPGRRSPRGEAGAGGRSEERHPRRGPAPGGKPAAGEGPARRRPAGGARSPAAGAEPPTRRRRRQP